MDSGQGSCGRQGPGLSHNLEARLDVKRRAGPQVVCHFVRFVPEKRPNLPAWRDFAFGSPKETGKNRDFWGLTAGTGLALSLSESLTSVSFEILFKRYFGVVVAVCVAFAAYLQAAGISSLLSAALVSETPPALPALPALPEIVVPQFTAMPIIDRNPFDSITGPLHDKPEDKILEEEKKKPLEITDPLSAPVCTGIQVFIVTESTDPLWSFAAVQGPGETAPSLRRVGDTIGTAKVAYIGFNPRSLHPALWLEGDSLCQASMFGDPEPPPPPAAEPAAEAPAPEGDAGRGMDPDLKSKIKRISETELEVDRSAVDKILENQADLMKSARIVPEQKDGKVVGIRLFGVRPETLLGQLGLANGDRLERINGFDMGSPEKALEAYARLRTAESLTLEVNRRGKPTKINIKIK